MVATTASTARRRFRCRAFCGRDRRQGIFLHGVVGLVRVVVERRGEKEGGSGCVAEDRVETYQRTPIESDEVGRNAVNIFLEF